VPNWTLDVSRYQDEAHFLERRAAMNLDVHEGYRKNAEQLIRRFEAISSADVLAPMCFFLGNPPGRVADIGAGTGRDASWLASRGFDVVAVEPVEEFRIAGMRLHPSERIEWIDDSLPHLRALEAPGQEFNVVLLVAVWQHIAPEHRPAAMRRLKTLVRSSGRLIMSIRHGPGAPSRPCFEASDAATVRLASDCGFELLEHRSSGSVKKTNRDAGVTWTWLVLGVAR
jgi:2-polyprenyl-3-methyl-5-hydroxy-6-metoxy-1,4-benzoquinol methylase